MNNGKGLILLTPIRFQCFTKIIFFTDSKTEKDMMSFIRLSTVLFPGIVSFGIRAISVGQALNTFSYKFNHYEHQPRRLSMQHEYRTRFPGAFVYIVDAVTRYAHVVGENG